MNENEETKRKMEETSMYLHRALGASRQLAEYAVEFLEPNSLPELCDREVEAAAEALTRASRFASAAASKIRRLQDLQKQLEG